MKMNKIFSALMLIGAVAFTACSPNPPQPPTPNPGGETEGDTLTVAQAIAKQDNSTALVKGYIVGWYNNHNNAKKVEFGAENTADTTVIATNIVIADAADETSQANTLCVQLPQGAMRSALNLKDNKGNLGKNVVLEGVLTNYNSLPGLKNLSAAWLEGKDVSKIDPTEAKEITVAEAIEIVNGLEQGAKTSEIYKIHGTVDQVLTNASDVPGKYTNINFKIKDATGTFSCFYTNYLENKPFESANQIPNLGAELIVVGPLKSYVNKNTGAVTPEMENGYILEIISNEQQDIVDGGAITIADFLTKEDNSFVWYTLTGTVGTLKSGDQYGNFDLTDETGTVYVYGLTKTQQKDLKNDKSFQSLGLKEGDNITISGTKTTYGNKIEVNCAYLVKKN